MGTVTAYKALNLVSPTIYYGEVTSHSANHITISDGVRSGTYFGSFTFTASGLAGGTITGYDFYENGVLAAKYRGGNVDALTLDAYLTDNNAPGAYGYALRGSDTINGSAVADKLRGFAGSDVLNGGGGNDYLQGDAGTDRLNGGGGRDVMRWDGLDTFDGGNGFDTLKVASGNLDLTGVGNLRLLNLEEIDLRAGNHVLTLKRSDVLSMSPTDEVKILGDSGDTVNIAGAFTAGAINNGFQTYSLGSGAKLLVDVDINIV
jgi:hypothetical protein